MKNVYISAAGGGAIQIESTAGVYAALHDAGINRDNCNITYEACSGGGPTTCLVASNMSGPRVAALIRETPMSSVVTPPSLWRRQPYFDGTGVETFLRKRMPSVPLTNCRLAVTRDSDMASLKVYATPITGLATMSIQGVFVPQLIAGEPYGDGGVKNLIPTCPVKDLDVYDLVVFILPPIMPEDTEAKKEPWYASLLNIYGYSRIVRALTAYTAIGDRELNHFKESRLDEFDNVVILEPVIPKELAERSLYSRMLEFTPDYQMIDVAYDYTSKELEKKCIRYF